MSLCYRALQNATRTQRVWQLPAAACALLLSLCGLALASRSWGIGLIAWMGLLMACHGLLVFLAPYLPGALRQGARASSSPPSTS